MEKTYTKPEVILTAFQICDTLLALSINFDGSGIEDYGDAGVEE